MPPLPKLLNTGVSRIESRLIVRPRRELLAAVAVIEQLATEIAPEAEYPEEWVEFRLTGNRESQSSPTVIDGQDLLTDLSSLAERLCDSAVLPPKEASGCVPLSVLCERWQMSKQTVARLRKRGLIARRVTDERRRTALVFLETHVVAFEAAHDADLKRAAAYSRIDAPLEAKMRKRAERYRRLLKLSVSAAAKRIANRYGRSHEAVRQLLLRAPAEGVSGRALPADPALDERRRRRLFRAWRVGVDLGLIARKTSRSRAAVRRAINMCRADKLRAVAASNMLTPDIGASLPRVMKEPGVLEASPVITGLGLPGSPTLRRLIDGARQSGPPIAVEERARLLGYHVLRVRAAAEIATLDRLHPSAETIDSVETMLLWAARLKAELIRSQLRLVLDSIASRLLRTVDEVPPQTLVRILRDSIQRAGEAIDTFDPLRGGRLAAAVGLGVDKAATAWARQLGPVATNRRAVPLLSDTGLEDWTRLLCPWQAFLEPDRRIREVVERGRIAPESVQILRWKWGWWGGPPLTSVQISQRLAKRAPRTAALEREAVRAALDVIRGVRLPHVPRAAPGGAV